MELGVRRHGPQSQVMHGSAIFAQAMEAQLLNGPLSEVEATMTFPLLFAVPAFKQITLISTQRMGA